jgi:hypothetical protein
MRRKSRTPVGPVSTHTTIHLLVSPDALPAIRVNQTMLADAAGEPTVYLHVEAEHRTTRFDHTATVTISGPNAAIRQLLDECKAALAQLPPQDAEHVEAPGCGS